MLGGLVKGRVDTAGAGTGKRRSCILELDARESVVLGPSARDLRRGPQPLWGVERLCYDAPVDKMDRNP